MATLISPSPMRPGFNRGNERKGRATVSGAAPRIINTAMRQGRSSVPTPYIPRTSSSSSGESSDSGKSTDSTTSDASALTAASFSSSPKRRLSVLSMFQTPSTPQRAGASVVYEKRSQQKDPHLEEVYGKCTVSLGSGSHANVMLCDSAIRGRMFAVKRFRKLKPHESEREYNKRLFSEYCISSTTRHENIVETLDLIRDEDNRLCLIMELCAGGDLFSYIKAAVNRPTNFGEINCYFKQLLNGLAYLHSMGVAHRDIKPENLLLSADGTILKISDFGVAEVFKTISDRQAHKCVGLCGSEPYIAPEQFENSHAEYDAAKVDIWSAGVVLYCLLTGSMPWKRACHGDSDYEHYLDSLKLSQSFYAFDRVDQDVRDILSLLLQPNPSLRSSAKEMKRNKWVMGIPSCHTDDPSPHHTHFAMAHRSSTN